MTPASRLGPPGYRPRPLHYVLVLSDLFGRVPPLLIAPALAGLAACAAYPWQHPTLQAAAGALTLLAIVGDGVSLALLPRRGRSFGPVTPPLLAAAVGRGIVTAVLGAVWPHPHAIGLLAGLQLALTAAGLYSTWVEPHRLEVNHARLSSPKLRGGPLRVLHVSDIHFEGWTAREQRLLDAAEELAPDLILLTGDYLSLSSVNDPAAHAGVRELLSALAGRAPTYAIAGSPPVDLPHLVPAIFAGLPITWLLDDQAEVDLNGLHLRLIGVRCTRNRQEDGRRLCALLSAADRETFTVLLYHSPDLMPDAVEGGIDLFLTGHTHGGQLCIPLFGAVYTSSDFWKRYEAGLYREGSTVLYVSRGLGMEGLGAPRARFLARPEIVLWTLSGAQGDAPGQPLVETTHRPNPRGV